MTSGVLASRAGLQAATARLLGGGRRGPARTNRTLRVGLAILAAVVLVSVVLPLVALAPPNQQDLVSVLQPPSWAHPFGTDNLGRDVLARTLAATQLDLRVALALTAISIVVGVLAGALAGFFGGWVDALVMRLVDVVIAFPFMVLVIATVAIFGPGLTGVYVGVTLIGWSLYARLTRAEMLVLREREFMLAAHTLGYSRTRIVVRHALPNLVRPSAVYAMADVVLNILLIASLSYLGLGVQPPTAEWGGIIADGQSYLLTAWWISTLPGLVVVLVGIGFSLVGDGLGDLLGTHVELPA